jgi:hypothetical protein
MVHHRARGKCQISSSFLDLRGNSGWKHACAMASGLAQSGLTSFG